MRAVAAEGVVGSSNQVIELLTGELVSNAVVHGPADGQVVVGLRIDGAQWARPRSGGGVVLRVGHGDAPGRRQDGVVRHRGGRLTAAVGAS